MRPIGCGPRDVVLWAVAATLAGLGAFVADRHSAHVAQLQALEAQLSHLHGGADPEGGARRSLAEGGDGGGGGMCYRSLSEVVAETLREAHVASRWAIIQRTHNITHPLGVKRLGLCRKEIFA